MSGPMIPQPDAVIDIKPLDSASASGLTGTTEANPIALPQADSGAAALFKSILSSAMPKSSSIKQLSEALTKSTDLLNPSDSLERARSAMLMLTSTNIISKFAGSITQTIKQLTSGLN